MRWMSSLLVLIALLVGCKGGSRAALEAKCDASLRLQVEELATSGADSLLTVLGRATAPLDDAQKRKLESAGAQVQQVTEDLFTARIPVKRMGHVAALDFVKSLALSQTREPHTP